jgi:hypothetical protein
MTVLAMSGTGTSKPAAVTSPRIAIEKQEVT